MSDIQVLLVAVCVLVVALIYMSNARGRDLKVAMNGISDHFKKMDEQAHQQYYAETTKQREELERVYGKLAGLRSRSGAPSPSTRSVGEPSTSPASRAPSSNGLIHRSHDLASHAGVR